MAASTLYMLQTLTVSTLTLVSFIFTILAITTEQWSSSAQYTSTTPPNINNRKFQGSSYRGPFRDCPLLQNATTSAFENVCYEGTCFPSDAVQFGGPWWCQQLETGAKLLISGCVFTGLGLVSCAIGVPAALLASRSCRGTRSKQWDERMIFGLWRWFTRMMLVVALGTMVVGWAIATEVLVNQQKFDGNYISTLTVPVTSDHWVMSKGVIFGAMGWIPTIIATMCLPSRPVLGQRTAREVASIMRESQQETVA